MKSFSYWESKYFWQAASHVVIGGGITGLTTAIFVKKKNPQYRVLVLERGALPSGASTKNAGFACFGSISEILDDLTHSSEDSVFALIEKRLRGLSMLRELLGDEKLGFEGCGGYEIFLEGEDSIYQKCIDSMAYINENLERCKVAAPFEEVSHQISSKGFAGVKHMTLNQAEGLINTGMMMHNLITLAREVGVEIYTGVEVLEIEAENSLMKVHCAQGCIPAEKVCVATNAFAERLLPELDVKPCRAQVLLTSPVAGLKVNGAFHHHYGFDYFRHVDGRVLFGGGRHLDKEAEQTDQFGESQLIQNYLENMLNKVILPHQEFEIDMRWSGIMGMGGSKEVIVREMSSGLYCAVRFGGMGVALGTAIGREVAGLM